MPKRERKGRYVSRYNDEKNLPETGEKPYENAAGMALRFYPTQS